MNIYREASAYNQTLQRFVESNRLNRRLFENHDHLAFKAYNGDDYKALVNQFKEMSYETSETWQADRRIATARLKADQAIDMTMDFQTAHSMVHWVEIMEAKREDQADQPPKLDHAEIYFRKLDAIRAVLNMSGIPFTDEGNEAHEWVSVEISEDGDELKFTDKPLGIIASAAIAFRRARML